MGKKTKYFWLAILLLSVSCFFIKGSASHEYNSIKYKQSIQKYNGLATHIVFQQALDDIATNDKTSIDNLEDTEGYYHLLPAIFKLFLQVFYRDLPQPMQKKYILGNFTSTPKYILYHCLQIAY